MNIKEKNRRLKQNCKHLVEEANKFYVLLQDVALTNRDRELLESHKHDMDNISFTNYEYRILCANGISALAKRLRIRLPHEQITTILKRVED